MAGGGLLAAFVMGWDRGGLWVVGLGIGGGELVSVGLDDPLLLMVSGGWVSTRISSLTWVISRRLGIG